jgi:hypothetical protein
VVVIWLLFWAGYFPSLEFWSSVEARWRCWGCTSSYFLDYCGGKCEGRTVCDARAEWAGRCMSPLLGIAELSSILGWFRHDYLLLASSGNAIAIISCHRFWEAFLNDIIIVKTYE